MNKKEIRKLIGNKNININLSQLYSNVEKETREKSTIDGKLITTSYTLSSIIIDDLSQLVMGYLDDFWPYENKNKFKIRPDDKTLKFIYNLMNEMFKHASKIQEKDKPTDIDDIAFEIPIYTEFVLWRIYILLNEINKYVYNKPLFDWAEEISNLQDKDSLEILKYICRIDDIKSWRRTLFVLFDKIGNEEPTITIRD